MAASRHQATRLLEGKDDPRLEQLWQMEYNARSYSTAVQVSEHKPARENPSVIEPSTSRKSSGKFAKRSAIKNMLS
jgi:hypothetical protein